MTASPRTARLPASLRAFLPVLAGAALASPCRVAAQAPAPAAATVAAITAGDARLRVGIVAADSMQGRDTGSPGIRMARDYIAAELRRMGVAPAGDGGTYFAAVPLERSVYAFSAASRTAAGEHAFGRDEVVPLTGAAGVPGGARPAGEGRIVFGGYTADGSIPAARELTAAQLDGAVLVLRVGTPTGAIPAARSRVALESLWAPGSKLAAILVVSEGPLEEYWGAGAELLGGGMVARRGTLTPEGQGGGPPLFLATRAAAERLIGRRLGGARIPFEAPGTFRYELRPEIRPVEAWNVVGVVPGRDPARAGQYVALGAHYDHVGVGAAVRGDSVYNGADDDGSGTAALLEIAERYAALPRERRPARSLLFVWHTGEEKGLLGSEAFTERPTVPRDSIVAQLNVDMIGRNSPDSLMLVGARRRSTRLGDAIEAANRRQPRPFRIDHSWDAPSHPEHLYCRSDHYNYARFGIPIAFFTSGLHADYHEPSDEARTLDYDKLARVATLVGDVAGDLAALAERPAADRPLPPIGEPCA